MENYILPYIKQYKNIDDLLESTDKSNMTCVTNMSSFLAQLAAFSSHGMPNS